MLLVSSKDFDHFLQHVVVAAGIAERRYRGRHCGGRDVRYGRRMYDTEGRRTMEDGRSMTASGLFNASVADGAMSGNLLRRCQLRPLRCAGMEIQRYLRSILQR
jgi:hypothetical protein